MKSKTFMYKGRKYEPIGNILGGFKVRSDSVYISDLRFNFNSEIGNIDVKDFYKTARKNHASCDVYKINDSDNLYMLCGGVDYGSFCLIIKGTKIKCCEEYLRWYK